MNRILTASLAVTASAMIGLGTYASIQAQPIEAQGAPVVGTYDRVNGLNGRYVFFDLQPDFQPDTEEIQSFNNANDPARIRTGELLIPYYMQVNNNVATTLYCINFTYANQTGVSSFIQNQRDKLPWMAYISSNGTLTIWGKLAIPDPRNVTFVENTYYYETYLLNTGIDEVYTSPYLYSRNLVNQAIEAYSGLMNRIITANEEQYERDIAQAKDEEYRRGFTEGQSAVSDGSRAVMTLFGAITSVPSEVLNGLSGFTIWNVAIISILITFLIIALIVWAIKRFV